MRCSIMIMTVVVVCATGLISAKQITEIGIEKQGLAAIDANPYEKSPVKLKKLVDIHRQFHKKIKITFAGLIDELKPYLGNDDTAELSEIIETILDQYNDEIGKAEKALQANDIELTGDLLIRAAKELENIYIAQEMIINFKLELAPQTPKKKNSGIIKTIYPRGSSLGIFFISNL